MKLENTEAGAFLAQHYFNRQISRPRGNEADASFHTEQNSAAPFVYASGN